VFFNNSGCCEFLIVCGWWEGGTHASTKEGMEDRSVMSNWMDEALSFPCLDTKDSRFSFRRPTAITWLPFSTSFSAMARPMPEVEPRTRTVLYGNDILSGI